MQIKQLKYLIKIVECGSITQAAQQLYISQPSLTKAIVSLEEEYGIRIFVRKARGVELTLEGRTFLHYANGVITAADALDQNFIDTDAIGIHKTRLFLATQQLEFVYDLLLATYSLNEGKRIHYNMVETDRNDVTRQVLNGNADLGLIVRSSSDAKTFLWHTDVKRLNMHVIDTAGVYACIGPSSPFYARSSITFSEVEHCPQVVLDMEAQAKRDLYFDNMNHHFNVNKIIFFNTVSACEHFLLTTDALSFVSPWTRGCFRSPLIHTLPIVSDAANPSTPKNELLWLKRAGEPLNTTELQFLQLLYRHFNKELPDNIDGLS